MNTNNCTLPAIASLPLNNQECPTQDADTNCQTVVLSTDNKCKDTQASSSPKSPEYLGDLIMDISDEEEELAMDLTTGPPNAVADEELDPLINSSILPESADTTSATCTSSNARETTDLRIPSLSPESTTPVQAPTSQPLLPAPLHSSQVKGPRKTYSWRNRNETSPYRPNLPSSNNKQTNNTPTTTTSNESPSPVSYTWVPRQTNKMLLSKAPWNISSNSNSGTFVLHLVPITAPQGVVQGPSLMNTTITNIRLPPPGHGVFLPNGNGVIINQPTPLVVSKSLRLLAPKRVPPSVANENLQQLQTREPAVFEPVRQQYVFPPSAETSSTLQPQPLPVQTPALIQNEVQNVQKPLYDEFSISYLNSKQVEARIRNLATPTQPNQIVQHKTQSTQTTTDTGTNTDLGDSDNPIDLTMESSDSETEYSDAGTNTECESRFEENQTEKRIEAFLADSLLFQFFNEK